MWWQLLVFLIWLEHLGPRRMNIKRRHSYAVLQNLSPHLCGPTDFGTILLCGEQVLTIRCVYLFNFAFQLFSFGIEIRNIKKWK